MLQAKKKIPLQPKKKEKDVILGCFMQPCLHDKSISEFLAEELRIWTAYACTF